MIKTVTQKVLCDYCGGYVVSTEEEDYSVHMSQCDEITDISIECKRDGHYNKRRICVSCWIKVFDTVLGKPQKKEGIDAGATL